MTGYCFLCDAPAEGEVCPGCGSRLYREAKRPDEKRRGPTKAGGHPADPPTGLDRRGFLAIVAIVLLLIVIGIVAASSAGLS